MNQPTPFFHRAGLLVIGLVLVAGIAHEAAGPAESLWIAPSARPVAARLNATPPNSLAPGALPELPDTGGSIGAPMLQEPPPPEGGILERLVTLVINFPANKIKEAIRKALLGIMQGEAKLLKDGLVGVVSVTIFQTEAPSEESGDVFGRINVSATLRSLETVMTMVAIPIWGLSLSMLALAIVLRNATASGYDLGDIAYEFVRWGFICFCSGNGMGIANLIHIGFNLMAEAILNSRGVKANNFIEALLPAAAIQLQTFPIVVLMAMMIVSAVIVIVMALSYIARAVLVLAFVGLAPLAFATEAIPYTRFVFREWVSTFLRIEMLQVINAFAYLLWAKVLANMAAGAGDYQHLLQMERMNLSYLGPILLSSLAAVGLASVIIAINWSVFKFVFGVAVEVGSGVQRAAGAVLGFLSTAVNGGPPSPMLALASSATGNPMLQSMAAGQRLGQQQANHDLPGGQSQRGQAEMSSNSSGQGRSDSSRFSRRPSEEARDASYQSRARQQQSRAMARDAGARSETEADSVASAHEKLAGRYGETAANRAMKAAAGFTNEQARRQGRGEGSLTKAAKSHGADSAGTFVGGAAEDVLLNERGGGDSAISERLFPSPAQAASKSSASGKGGKSGSASLPSGTSQSGEKGRAEAPNSGQPPANSAAGGVASLMAKQPSLSRGDWNQTSWFDHLSANQVLQSLHGDPANLPKFAEMMGDIRQLPASMSSGSNSADDGLFKRILTGAGEIGQRTSDPQQAYGQFQKLVDGELRRTGEIDQVRAPWRQKSSASGPGNEKP